MDPKTASHGWARSALALVLGLAWISGSATTSTDEPPPQTFPRFVQSTLMALREKVTEKEWETLRRLQPDELRSLDPELYGRVTRDVVKTTDEWARKATAGGGDALESRIRRAEEQAAWVNFRLQGYFRSLGWEYKKMRVIFLPRRVMVDPGSKRHARGTFVPLYPDAFFASLDPESLRQHVLIHESIHFNMTGPHLGRPLTEGITEEAARHLALEWTLVRRNALDKANYYPQERRLVRYLLDRMVERSGKTHDQAREILLRASLTGELSEVGAILGADAWSRIVEASRSDEPVLRIAHRLLEK